MLSHRAAAALWGIRQNDLVEVTVPRGVRPRARIRIRETTLQADETQTHDGIPVTTPARTLLDLAALLPAQQLECAADEAEVRRLASPTSLDALVTRYPGRPGTPAIKRLLDTRAIGADVTKEELEHRFRAFLDELDGAATHHTRHAFERDRARDRKATASGHRVVRVTWRQLHEDAETLATELRALIEVPSQRTP